MNNNETAKPNAPEEKGKPADNITTSEQAPIHLHNPFTGKEMDVTQQDLDNLEKFKEAQTERD